MRRGWVVVFALIALSAASVRGDDDLVLVGPGGDPVSPRPAPGQLLLLHFWATWCPTCVDDLAHLQNAATDCSTERLRVIAVNVGETAAEISEFIDKHGVLLAILRDPDGRVSRRVDGRGVPMNLFWSSEGRRTDVGPKTEGEWRQEFAPIGCG